MAGESRGVSALDRWNSSMFLNDFLIDRLRDGARGGVIISSLGTSWTSRKSKLPRPLDRDDGTNRDRCLFGLAGLSPMRRPEGEDEGKCDDTSRKSGERTATPSVEFLVGNGRRRSDLCCSSMLALEDEGDEAEVLRRKDVRRSH